MSSSKIKITHRPHSARYKVYEQSLWLAFGFRRDRCPESMVDDGSVDSRTDMHNNLVGIKIGQAAERAHARGDEAHKPGGSYYNAKTEIRARVEAAVSETRPAQVDHVREDPIGDVEISVSMSTRPR
jgi:hypothetical protein